MTDQRFTTEEAERIAFAIQGRAMEVTGAGELVYDEELRDAAAALRSLAAERDALRESSSRDISERLRDEGDAAYCRGYQDGQAAARVENERTQVKVDRLREANRSGIAENERLREELRAISEGLLLAHAVRRMILAVPDDGRCHCVGCEKARTALGEEDR